MIKITFIRTSENRNMYMKIDKDENKLIVDIFLDDIIFWGNDKLGIEFSHEMKKEFEMSMIGEINFFIGLQVS